MKKRTPPPPVQYEKAKNIEDSAYQTWNAEDDFNKTKHNDDYSFKIRDQKKKSLFEKNKASYTSLEKNTSLLTEKKPRTKTKLQKIFSNPSNLKEYIIISEVLGKPKALRR
jgi:hypothetical protein